MKSTNVNVLRFRGYPRRLAVVALVALAASAFIAFWVSQAEVARGSHDGLNKVAIPEVNSLLVGEVLVATGRADSPELRDCLGITLVVARYGVLTGQTRDQYAKMYWKFDPGAGTRMTVLNLEEGSCLIGSTWHNLYDVVQVPHK